MTADEVATFVANARTAVLTTLGRDGMPHSAAMWFVPTTTEVQMWTYARSQKAMNARRDPRCAWLVEAGEEYFDLKGVLVRGRLDVIEQTDRIARIGTALYARYNDSPPEGVALAEIERQASKRIGMILRLDRVTSWDHSKLSDRLDDRGHKSG
jgi:PPOX class probable F420-dependent enzyme